MISISLKYFLKNIELVEPESLKICHMSKKSTKTFVKKRAGKESTQVFRRQFPAVNFIKTRKVERTDFRLSSEGLHAIPTAPNGSDILSANKLLSKSGYVQRVSDLLWTLAKLLLDCFSSWVIIFLESFHLSPWKTVYM